MASLMRPNLKASLRRMNNERGAQLVELAFALPILMLVTCGIFDFGFAFQRYEVLTNAAREGARLASLPGYTADQVTARVQQYLNACACGVSGAVVDPPKFSDMSAGGVTFKVVEVTVTYTHQFSIVDPMIRLVGSVFRSSTVPLSSVPLKAKVVMRLESQGS